MSAYVDLTGRRVGRLLIERRVSNADGPAQWQCLCDCGTRTEVAGKQLRSQKTRSCGCLQRERAADAHRRHGAKHRGRITPEYASWKHAKRRCTDTADKDYRLYGARGITMKEPWFSDFAAFLRDMGPRPDGHTLDRIDPNGHYEAGNCRWASSRQQATNTSRNIFIVVDGATLSLTEACKRYRLSRWAVYKHRKAHGVTAEVAIQHLLSA